MKEIHKELDLKLDPDDLVNHIINMDQKTERNSEATTMKEGSKERDKHLSSSNKSKNKTRDSSKQKSKKFWILNSPPHSQIENVFGTTNKLIPELTNLAKKGTKVFASLRNQQELHHEEVSSSIKEDDFDLVRTSKPSFTGTNDNLTVDNYSDSKHKYEEEIRNLTTQVSDQIFLCFDLAQWYNQKCKQKGGQLAKTHWGTRSGKQKSTPPNERAWDRKNQKGHS